MEKNEETIYLIAGVINATGKMFYWKDENFITIGNYAIVENMNGYDLVKVVGRVTTTKEEAIKFSNTKYNNMEKTITEVTKEKLEEIKKNI